MRTVNIGVSDVREVGTCNFCKRGELVRNRTPNDPLMTFPYTRVYQLVSNSGGTVVNVCEECMDTIKKNTLKL